MSSVEASRNAATGNMSNNGVREIIGGILGGGNDKSHTIGLLQRITSTREGREQICNLEGPDAETFLTVMQEILDPLMSNGSNHGTHGQRPNFREMVIKVMIRLARKSGRLPKTLWISDVTWHHSAWLGGGSFGDVYKGRRGGHQKELAVKIVRQFTKQDNTQMEKQFYSEVLVWRQLSHRNILPFLGISETEQRRGIVSEYQRNGNMRNYLKKQPDADRYRLLIQVTIGLSHLHDQGVIHRDLKGDNILIGDDGRAMLADFGLSRVHHDLSEALTTSSGGGTRQYMSPELLDGSSGSATEASDIWALGMVIYEAFTLSIPFGEIHNLAALITAIANGRLPTKPAYTPTISGLTDELWNFLKECCWVKVAKHRVGTQTCSDRLEELSRRWEERKPALIASSQQVVEEIIIVDQYGRSLVPPRSSRLESYQQQFEVQISIHRDFKSLSLRGSADRVKALKAVIENDIEKNASLTSDRLIIPERLHKLLIGPDGKNHKQLQDQFSVNVHFEKDGSGAVVIRGLRDGVVGAKSQLQKSLEYHELHDDIRQWNAKLNVVNRVRCDRQRILSQTKLKSIDPIKIDGSVFLELRGGKEALQAAKVFLTELQQQLDEEESLDITKDVPLVRQLLTRSNLPLILARCNGPSDPDVHKHLFTDIVERGRIRLHGKPSFIRDFKKELEAEVERRREISIPFVVPHERHNVLRRQWSSTRSNQERYAYVHFPSSAQSGGNYSQILESRDTDPMEVITITGTRELCEKTLRILQGLLREQQRLEQRVHFKAKYHHDIIRPVKNKLRELNVYCDFSNPPAVPLEPLAPSPPAPSPSSFSKPYSWDISARYNPEDDTKFTWNLKATTEEHLSEAISVLTSAVRECSAASHIGFLTFRLSMKSKFGLIVGRDGETVRRLQDNTNTRIDVPEAGNDSTTIKIVGSEGNIEKAKEMIVRLISEMSPDPYIPVAGTIQNSLS